MIGLAYTDCRALSITFLGIATLVSRLVRRAVCLRTAKLASFLPPNVRGRGLSLNQRCLLPRSAFIITIYTCLVIITRDVCVCVCVCVHCSCFNSEHSLVQFDLFLQICTGMTHVQCKYCLLSRRITISIYNIIFTNLFNYIFRISRDTYETQGLLAFFHTRHLFITLRIKIRFHELILVEGSYLWLDSLHALNTYVMFESNCLHIQRARQDGNQIV